MQEKKPDTTAHELRDCPVPPVKGAVNVPEDVRIWPEHKMGRRCASAENAGAVSPESWL